MSSFINNFECEGDSNEYQTILLLAVVEIRTKFDLG